MVLCDIIKTYRLAKGLTLDQLARECGVQRIALWRIEHGTAVNMKHWVALLRWLFKD